MDRNIEILTGKLNVFDGLMLIFKCTPDTEDPEDYVADIAEQFGVDRVVRLDNSTNIKGWKFACVEGRYYEHKKWLKDYLTELVDAGKISFAQYYRCEM